MDWEYMVRKNNVIFNEVMAACADKRIKVLMGFKHNWNKEIIAQFFATQSSLDTMMVRELCSG